jgi:hypothetical protein
MMMTRSSLLLYMIMEVANDGFCARKEIIIAWLQVLLIRLLHMEDIHMKEAPTNNN